MFFRPQGDTKNLLVGRGSHGPRASDVLVESHRKLQMEKDAYHAALAAGADRLRRENELFTKPNGRRKHSQVINRKDRNFTPRNHDFAFEFSVLVF